jgi:hypothetical protein
MKKVLKIAKKLWWLGPLVIVGGAVIGAWVVLRPTSTTNNIVDCKGAQAGNFQCWQKRYTAMVKLQSTQAAFKDVKTAYAQSAFIRSNCHQLAHVIGRAAAERYGGDVVKAYNEGDNFCWSGYYHGVMEKIVQGIGADNIANKINDICTSAKAQQEFSFYHYNCVHGLGHGMMAITNNQLFEALKTCDRLDGAWQQESCYSGVFMENILARYLACVAKSVAFTRRLVFRVLGVMLPATVSVILMQPERHA